MSGLSCGVQPDTWPGQSLPDIQMRCAWGHSVDGWGCHSTMTEHSDSEQQTQEDCPSRLHSCQATEHNHGRSVVDRDYHHRDQRYIYIYIHTGIFFVLFNEMLMCSLRLMGTQIRHLCFLGTFKVIQELRFIFWHFLFFDTISNTFPEPQRRA